MRLKTICPLSVVMFVVLSALSLGAHADVTLTIESRGRESKVLIKGPLLRMSRGTSDAGYMIFNAKKKELITIDRERREAAVMNEADLQKMGNQLGNLSARMQAQMENMPPEQRQKMQQMMERAIPSSVKQPEVKIEVVKTGAAKMLLDKQCSQFVVKHDGQKSFEYWVAPKNSLDGGDEVVRAFTSLGEFFSDLFEALRNVPMRQVLDNPFAAVAQIDGVPLETVQYKNGRAGRVTTIVSVEKGSLAQEAFVIPSGYRTVRPADRLPG